MTTKTKTTSEMVPATSPPVPALPLSVRIAVVGMVVLVRILVGYQPHSGQDNHHGGSSVSANGADGPPYGGDFEAQRHWMELTTQLPVSQWYYHDLHYWGLDYPPLSAYQSWLCGTWIAAAMGTDEAIALYTSRGYEHPVHKATMRATVLAFDMTLYATAAWWWIRRIMNQEKQHTYTTLPWFLTVMCQPAIVLMDHGHFQYNTAALGLALWSFYFITVTSQQPQTNILWGAILFCAAVSFKQMTLYYAPAIFAYLLGYCFSYNKTNSLLWWFAGLRRVAVLGITVLATFAALWWPFTVYGPADTTPLDRLLHVLRRIFPLQRGLFEGKVSNLWCVLSLRPVRIRDRLPERVQPLAALLLTLTMILPGCIQLFHMGRRRQSYSNSSLSSSAQQQQRALLWGMTNTSLAFFLASFQVHEKSILMAVTPMSVLASTSPSYSHWFALVATWTLWPLLELDRLQVAYVCVMLLFIVLLWGLSDMEEASSLTILPSRQDTGIFAQHWLLRWIPLTTGVVCAGLHILEILVEPPTALPDLFPVLWSVVGCGMFVFAWMVSLWELLRIRRLTETKTKLE